MKRILISLLSFPFEAFIFVIGCGVFITLYAQLIFVPTFFASLIGGVLYLNELVELYAFYVSVAVGVVVGIVWAESIRRKYSVFGFHGYIMGHPEIDGWQRPNEGVVFRNGNLTTRPEVDRKL